MGWIKYSDQGFNSKESGSVRFGRLRPRSHSEYSKERGSPHPENPNEHSPFLHPAALPRAGPAHWSSEWAETTLSSAHAFPEVYQGPSPEGPGSSHSSQGHQHRPHPAPAQAEKEGPGLSARAPAPGPGRRKGGLSAHHCAPRWSVVLIKARSSDFWVSASGRSRQPPPSAISSVSQAQPARTSASRTPCCGPRPRTHARIHARARA